MMSHHAIARSRSAGLTRSVWGLLALFWLNMAVLPCAMAFESGDHDCAHCPPTVEHEMASHHGHGEEHANESAATTQSECCDLEDASIDIRGSNLKLNPPSEVVFISEPAIAVVPACSNGQLKWASDPPEIISSSPTPHVLFCVYLK